MSCLRLSYGTACQWWAEMTAGNNTAADDIAEKRLQKLLTKLPENLAALIRQWRGMEARWKRIPVAFLFLIGSLFFWLPILGVWMLPLGLLLLAEDIPVLRSVIYRFVNWLADRRPDWFR